MNVLVTGANGQLGNEMQIVTQGCIDNYIFTDVVGDYQKLDITNANDVMKMVQDNHIDIIVNCAAYTNVDKAEDDADFCEVLNSKAVENLAIAIKSVNGLLIHISTDYVFGGNQNNTPCTEDEKENPTGVYGLTKLHGEQAIKSVDCKHTILRTAWLYSEFGKNFVKTMLNLTETKPMLKVVFDQVGTPTYALDLAKTIVKIIDDYKSEASKEIYSKTGIYHFSNEGVCSWFDFTKMIAEIADHKNCDILPCHSSEFPSKVIRPNYSVLDKTKVKETFCLDIPYWTDSLRICINNLAK